MTTTSPPTLAEIRRFKITWHSPESRYTVSIPGFDGGEVVDASAHDALISTLHSQIDGLMKRLLKSEANERRYLWLRSGGSGTGLYVADAEREWVEVDGEELDELVDDALSAQGGGDG